MSYIDRNRPGIDPEEIITYRISEKEICNIEYVKKKNVKWSFFVGGLVLDIISLASVPTTFP